MSSSESTLSPTTDHDGLEKLTPYLPSEDLISQLYTTDPCTARYLQYISDRMQTSFKYFVRNKLKPLVDDMVATDAARIADKYNAYLKNYANHLGTKYSQAIKTITSYTDDIHQEADTSDAKEVQQKTPKVTLSRDSQGVWRAQPYATSAPQQDPCTLINAADVSDPSPDITPATSSTQHGDQPTAELITDDADAEQPLKSPKKETLPELEKQPAFAFPIVPAFRLKRKIKHSTKPKNVKRVRPQTPQPTQCLQHYELPILDFKNTQSSYIQMHNFLKICNCAKCVKQLFEHQVKTEGATKCDCIHCQPYWYYTANQDALMVTPLNNTT